jgi:hypothetical protein
MKIQTLIVLATFWIVRMEAQNVLFDFDSLAAHSGLPGAYTVGGITAGFSATGQGFAIQPANSLGFTPVGFAGNCIYPSSIYAADLIVDSSTPLTDFSILYAPEEYACDSSATMRVTAYLDGALVGSATTNAQAGTWPSETLQFHSAQPFNKVVVHYDKPPATGGDWGPIFMADNMVVTPAPPPIVLANATMSVSGGFQFDFTNAPGGTFTVRASTNPALAITNWAALGAATEMSPGQYQFTDLQATNHAQRFYRVSSP